MYFFPFSNTCLYCLYCVFGFWQMYVSFLNKGIIMCGMAVTLRITMTAFSVSVRLCCAGVKSCLSCCKCCPGLVFFEPHFCSIGVEIACY